MQQKAESLCCYTISLLEHRHYPITSCDAVNDLFGESSDNITKTIDNSFKRRKHFIPEPAFSKFFPNLFDWIHLWGIRRNEINMDIVGYHQTL